MRCAGCVIFVSFPMIWVRGGLGLVLTDGVGADRNNRKASQDGVQRHLREYHEVLTTVRVPLQGR